MAAFNLLAYGSATPMRGKSLTADRALFLVFAVYDRKKGRRPLRERIVAGKSKTCRASEWQSHSFSVLAFHC